MSMASKPAKNPGISLKAGMDERTHLKWQKIKLPFR
jgi:hypothetical protein